MGTGPGTSRGRAIAIALATAALAWYLHRWSVHYGVNRQLAAALDRLGERRHDVQGVYLSTGDLDRADSGFRFLAAAQTLDGGFARITVVDGSIEARVTGEAASGLAGNHLYRVPEKTDGSALQWHCRTPDIAADLLPRACH